VLARGKAMAKGKKDNTIFDYQEGRRLTSKLPLHKWKLFELCAQGMRLDHCQCAIQDAGQKYQVEHPEDFYNSVPNDYPIPKNISLADITRIRMLFVHEKENAEEIDDLSVIETLEDSMRRQKEELLKPLNLTSTKKTFDYIQKSLQKIKIQKEDDLDSIQNLIHVIMGCGCDYDKLTDEEKEKFLLLEYLITAKTYEALGYWTSQVEHLKKHRINLHSKIRVKEQRKSQLKEWMKIMKPNKYRIQAQMEWDVKDRTVLLYEQEIRDEEKIMKELKNWTHKPSESEVKEYLAIRLEEEKLKRKKNV